MSTLPTLADRAIELGFTTTDWFDTSQGHPGIERHGTLNPRATDWLSRYGTKPCGAAKLELALAQRGLITVNAELDAASATIKSINKIATKPDYRAMILTDLNALAEKYAAADGINPRYIAVFETLLSLARLFLSH